MRFGLCCSGLLLTLSFVGSVVAEPVQDFSDDSSYRIESYYGGANVQAARLKEKGPSGKPSLSIKFDATAENSGAVVSWKLAPEALDGKTFSLRIRKGKVPYVRASFVSEGKQVCRHTYFGAGGDSWQKLTFAYGTKGTGAALEPATVPAGRPIDQIQLQLCGKANQSYEVEITDFAIVDETISAPKPKAGPSGGNSVAASGGKPSAGPQQDFADKETYGVKSFFDATDLRVIELEKPGPTGRPAIDVQAGCPRENSGVLFEWSFAPTVLDGKTFSVQIWTPHGPVPYVRVDFVSAEGKLVRRNTYFGVNAGDWKTITFAVIGQTAAASLEPKEPIMGQAVASIRLQLCGRRGNPVRATISDFVAAGEARVKRAEAPAVGAPTIRSADIAVWLDPANGHRLSAVQLGDRRFERSLVATYPSFVYLDSVGAQRTFAADDPGFKVTAAARGPKQTAVRYLRDGTIVELVYSAAGNVRCDVNLIEEGTLKLVAVGAAKMLGMELQSNDYGILPNGNLYHPVGGGTPRSFRRMGNADNAVPNFTAGKFGSRIVFYKPLTASQEMHLATEAAEGAELLWFGGSLFFRPSRVKNPATKHCHSTLAWQIETAGDENRDGAVDWVDCGIAYRDRYMKRNERLDPSIRDSVKFYHGMPGDTYERLAATAEKMDYCSTLWWVKGAMKTLISPGSEAHPYTLAPDPERGDRASFQSHYDAARAHVGIYFGHDYLDNTEGDWPAELVKLDWNGEPVKYYEHRGHRLLYKDNVRGMATGKLQAHYADIIGVCGLTRGNPVMLDTFTAYARESYHPDYPATPQLETEAKRELCRFFKDREMSIAGESVIEGTEDMLDFGAILVDLRKLEESKFWKNESWTPLLGLIYHGRTYTGVSTYEFRNPDPNWAASLVTGCSMWQWSTGHYPEMYAFGARMFFNQNSAWIPNADAEIIDVDRIGSEYCIRFNNGNTLWADPERQAWRLRAASVMFDGFTPFNDRGVMAILKQGDFDVTLPVTKMLEVIPSQPYREQLDVKIERTADGRIRVRGNFSKIPWKLKWYHKPAGAATDILELRDAAPVLMLRHVKA